MSAGLIGSALPPPPLPLLQLKFGKPRNAAGAGGSGPTAAVALLSNTPDIEELVTMGRQAGVCPFYLSREAGAVRG